MDTAAWWLVAALAALITAGLAWWLIFESEGVYLGRRVVIWLYDVYAGRYDRIKGFDEVDEHVLLAQPILDRLHPNTAPLVLDVATGTGRLPLALCQHARFEGQIIALDASRRMLAQATSKISEQHFDHYASFCRGDGEALPFADQQFDLVTCLEALEFMPHPSQALHECVRVLRPGGILLVTQRINTRWLPGKTWSDDALTQLLGQHDIQHIMLQPWMVDYKLVWGVRAAKAQER